MQRGLRDETTETIKLITEKLINFQGNDRLTKLHDQLMNAAIRPEETNGNIALFDLKGPDTQFDASSPLDVEGRLTDTSGNRLHAIVYLDGSGDLLALEVFPWDQWTHAIDVAGLGPVKYDDQGVSRPGN